MMAAQLIEMKNKEIVRLQTKIEKIEAAETKLRAEMEAMAAPAAKSAPAKPAVKKKTASATKSKSKTSDVTEK